MTWPAAATRAFPNAADRESPVAADRESPAAADREWPPGGPPAALPSKYLIFATAHGTAQTVNTTAVRHHPFVGSEISGSAGTVNATDVYNRTPCQYDFTLSGLATRLHANSATSSYTTRLRKNGANANQVVVLAAGVTASTQDTTNTDDFVVGDYVAVTRTLTSSGGSLTLWGHTMVMAGADTTKHVACYHGRAGVFNANANAYASLSGYSPGDSPLVQCEVKWQCAATFTAIGCTITANTLSVATTVALMVNGSDTAATATIPAGSTADITLSSLPISVAAGDLVALHITTPAGTGSITIPAVYAWTETDRATPLALQIAQQTSGETLDNNVAHFLRIGGATLQTSTTNETLQSVQHGFSGIASKLSVNIRFPVNTGTTTFKYRKNAADGNQTLTVPSLGAGWYTDTTNTDEFDANDECCYSAIRSVATGIPCQTVLTVEEYVSG